MIATAFVRVNPVPAGISVLRSTRPFAVKSNGTCLPRFGGWHCVCAKNAVPTMAPDWLTEVARLANSPGDRPEVAPDAVR